MFDKKGFFLVLLLVFTISIFAQNMVVVRFDNPTNELVREFTSIAYDVASYQPGKYLDIVVNMEEYDRLLEAGYEIRITQTEEQLKENLRSGADLAGYRDYEEMLADLQQAELDYPAICKLYDIGDSRGKEYSDAGNSNYDQYNHEIWALKVSDNVETEEDEPCIYYIAEHHAREPLSLETAMTILEHILDNYGTDPTITDNVNNSQIWFVPLVNPNGHKVVTDEENVWWRKNIRDNDENGVMNVTGYNPSDGVDINRNYGFEWGGASNTWSSEVYQGPAPFSEPETQAVRDLLAAHHFIAGISYHTYGEIVLYPYGYEDGIIAPDQAALSELATEMAFSIPAQYGGYYTPEASWALYPCTGTTDDFAYGMYGTFGYTIEMATEFIPSANQVQQICDNNVEAAMIMLDRANHSILKGHITDAGTGESLQAEIFVDGVDNTGVYRNPYMSDTEFGAYYRLLTAGTYDVTFSVYGYESQTIENVVISDTEPTIIDIVMLNSVPNAVVTGIITAADTGEPLENATIELPGFGIPAVTTNAQGEYTISGIYQYTYDLAVYADGYACHQEVVEITEELTELDFGIYALDDGTFENGIIGGCWTFGGQADWQLDMSEVYEGVYSIRSGSINDNQKSDIEVSMNVPNDDEISFFRKVSSENNYDYLKFFIDDDLQGQWCGNDDWSEASFAVTAGIHTFHWSYVKDGGVAGGSDCGWIDNVVFPSEAFIVTPAVLDFLTIENCGDGLSFSIINQSEGDITLTDITESGSVFAWYLDDFSLSLPYVLPAGEQLDFLVKVDFPVDPTEEILTDYLYVDSDQGQQFITLHFDDALNDSADKIPNSFVTIFYGNYPNPFNPSTTFKFSLSSNSKVSLNVYNVKGQLVKTLINEELESGFHTVVWHGDDNSGKAASSGVYFSTMDAYNGDKDFTSVKKIILLK